MQLDDFIAQSEKRAYHMALYASRNPDDALDIVQDAMISLAQKYGHKPSSEWGPLFHRILQSKINDWYRRTNVRQKWQGLLPFTEKNDDNSSRAESPGDPIENMPELKSSNGYYILLSVMTGIALVMLYLFRRMRWL